MRYIESNRFLVPADDAAARRYLASSLYVPRRFTERLRRMMRMPHANPAPQSSLAAIAPLLELLPANVPRRRIVLRDYETSGRGRVVAFLFEGDETSPSMIFKAQPRSASLELGREAEALESLRRMLPNDVLETIPEVLRFETTESAEALLTTALRGRSVYVDLQGSLIPSRFVDRHFEAAATWLASFHRAIGALAAGPPEDVGSHGDFWARNLLLSERGGVGVVDWEEFHPAASRYIDLFHFPLTYGLAYPWQRYRRVPAEAAFRKTFLEANRVSMAVRRYLWNYARATGLTQTDLGTAFVEFLKTHGSLNGRTALENSSLPWSSMIDHFQRARESVFSG